MNQAPAAAGAAVALSLLGAGVAAVTTPRSAPAWRPAEPAAGTVFTDVERARSSRYRRAARPAGYASLASAFVVTCVLGFTPAGARLAGDLAAAVGGAGRAPWPLSTVLAAAVAVILPSLAASGWRVRVQVARRRYGLSAQRWPGWWLDQGRASLVSLALVIAAALGFEGLVRARGSAWWAPVAAAAAAATVVASFVFPVLIEPLFNRFGPLPDGPLRERLLRLATGAGVPVTRVLVADASRRTNEGNAYVSGLGRTRRMVVWDTLVGAVGAVGTRNVELVVAHELGHVHHRDVAVATAVSASGAAAAGCVLFLLLDSGTLLGVAGVRGASDPRVVPLVVALLAVLGAIYAPAGNALSRRVEARADRYALDLTGAVDAFVDMQRNLAVRNLADLAPRRLPYLLFATHPSTAQRIAAARAWTASVPSAERGGERRLGKKR